MDKEPQQLDTDASILAFGHSALVLCIHSRLLPKADQLGETENEGNKEAGGRV